MTISRVELNPNEELQDAPQRSCNYPFIPSPSPGKLFYQPTILTGVDPFMPCSSSEIFGPVVAINKSVGFCSSYLFEDI